MHIAINCRFLAYPLEGIGWYLHELVDRWIKNYPEIKFSLIYDQAVDTWVSANVNPIIIGPKTSHTPSIAWWNEVVLTKWLNKNSPDLYFSPDGFIPLRVKTKTIATVHDISPLVYPKFNRRRDQLYYQVFQKAMMHRANHIITVSNFSKTEFLKHIPKLAADKISVIWNGLRSDLKEANSLAIDKFKAHYNIEKDYFVYLGSIHPRKNVLNVVKAFDLYKKRGGKNNLLLIGRFAWQSKEVEQALDNSLYKAAIQHIEFIENEHLSAALSAAVASIYISIYEGFGLPVIEALACNTAVITSQNSSMSEVGGNCVLTVDPLNLEEITTAMFTIETSNIMKDQEKIARRLKLFDWNIAAKKHMQVFQNIVASEK